MQEFDYSNETSNDLYDAVDGLSYEEAVMHESFEKQYCNTATPSSAVLLLDKFLKEDLFRDEYGNGIRPYGLSSVRTFLFQALQAA